MDKKKLIGLSFMQSLGVFVYIVLVAWIVNNGEKYFGQIGNFWGPIMFLMLFVFSALATGVLVLGRPIFYYLENQKKEAWFFLFSTVGWLFLMMLIVFGVILFG